MWTYPVRGSQYLGLDGSPVKTTTGSRDGAGSTGIPGAGFSLSNASGQSIITQPGETVLDAAERAGWEPSFGCREGRCRRCTTRLTRGRVTDVRHGLSSGTGASIPLCVSVPASVVEVQL